jgi:hypothetical protein
MNAQKLVQVKALTFFCIEIIQVIVPLFLFSLKVQVSQKAFEVEQTLHFKGVPHLVRHL